MKEKKQELIIPFIGLKNGIHQYEFEIDSKFFEQFEYSIIQDADFKVNVELDKRKTLFNLYFDLEGTIVTACDRCMEELEVSVEGSQELIVKFGDESFNETDEIRVLAPNEHELDLTKEIYEYIHLLLPTKVAHEDLNDCNQEIIEKLTQLNTKVESTEVDPRWAALSNFKDKSE